MKEIEIKAHVYNREQVISILNEKAKFLGDTEKSDTYYRIPLNNNYISVRIRKEITDKTSYFFTYKKKSIVTNSDGTSIEVNEENESELENPEAFVKLFTDLGGKISLTKQKIVKHWEYTVDNIHTHIELCTIPPLGDFLEIESIQESDDPELVSKIKKIEEDIFTLCNIPLTQIEPRYYSELLK